MSVLLLAVLFIVCTLFALGVVTRTNPVYSVLCLAVVFVGVSAVFLALQVEFVAMALVTLYLGAIIVLFLFVVMMIAAPSSTQMAAMPNRLARYYSVLSSCVVGVLGLVMALSIYSGSAGLVKVAARYPISEFGYDGASIGRILFSDFNLEFAILSFILLIGMIGAVVLTAQGISPGKKRQSVAEQLARHDSVKLVTVKSKSGVRW